jgi:hypothetical protein
MVFSSSRELILSHIARISRAQSYDPARRRNVTSGYAETLHWLRAVSGRAVLRAIALLAE